LSGRWKVASVEVSSYVDSRHSCDDGNLQGTGIFRRKWEM